MSMCVCVCTCVSVWVSVCKSVCACVCVRVSACVRVDKNVCMFFDKSMFWKNIVTVCVCVCVCVIPVAHVTPLILHLCWCSEVHTQLTHCLLHALQYVTCVCAWEREKGKNRKHLMTDYMVWECVCDPWSSSDCMHGCWKDSLLVSRTHTNMHAHTQRKYHKENDHKQTQTHTNTRTRTRTHTHTHKHQLMFLASDDYENEIIEIKRLIEPHSVCQWRSPFVLCYKPSVPLSPLPKSPSSPSARLWLV